MTFNWSMMASKITCSITFPGTEVRLIGKWRDHHIRQFPQHSRVQSIWPHGLVSIQLSEKVQNHLIVDYAGPILFLIPIYQCRGLCSQGVTSLTIKD